MPILCQFYVKMPLRNPYFFNMGLTPPPPSFEQYQKTTRLVERDIPNMERVSWSPSTIGQRPIVSVLMDFQSDISYLQKMLVLPEKIFAYMLVFPKKRNAHFHFATSIQCIQI